MQKAERKILYILLFLLPFHYLFCELILNDYNIDNIWRDVIILILFLLCFPFIQIDLSSIIILLITGFSISLSLISDDVSFGFNICRTYCLPMLIYFVARNLCKSKEIFNKIINIILTTGFLDAVWGLIVTYILGADFLNQIGYNLESSSSFYINGFYGIPRLLGTFASPNDTGEFFAIVLSLSVFKIHFSKLDYIKIGVISLALILTFSRSSIGALLVFLFLYFLAVGRKNFINPRSLMTVKIMPIVSICSIIILVVIILFNSQKYFQMIQGLLQSTLSGNDASANKHFEDLYLPLQTVLDNPLGLGYGNSGPLAQAHFGGSTTMVESSVYLVFFDYGIILGVLYYLPYLISICKIRSNIVQYRLFACFSCALFIIYLLLPAVQNYFIVFYFYLIAGCISNIKDGR